MLKMQNKMESSDTKLAEEVHKHNESFQQLKPDLVMTKNFDSKLHNCFVNMEKECWKNAQYSRREYVEIVAISTSVPDNELEKNVCKIAEKFKVKIDDSDIESCDTIVKFSHRKDCQQLKKVKKDLSKLNLTDIDLGNTKIFINQSLCPYYKLL